MNSDTVTDSFIIAVRFEPPTGQETDGTFFVEVFARDGQFGDLPIATGEARFLPCAVEDAFDAIEIPGTGRTRKNL